MSTYSADYLRRLMVSVDKFSEAFEAWAETQVEATHMGARGIFPTAWTKEGQDPVEVARLELEVAEKSGAASVATSVTGSYIVVQGMGALDPIANWSFMTAPKSPLTPRDVRMTVANVRGRLQAMLDDAEADTPGGLPAFSPALWHPVVWGAAAPQWVIHQYRVAVAEGAESLTHYWKKRLGRQDADASVFWQVNRPGFGGGCHSTRGWTAWQHHGSTRQSFKSARHVSRSKLAKIRNGDEEQYAGWPSSSV